jgi:hypothetical protein
MAEGVSHKRGERRFAVLNRVLYVPERHKIVSRQHKVIQNHQNNRREQVRAGHLGKLAGDVAIAIVAELVVYDEQGYTKKRQAYYHGYVMAQISSHKNH